jgi:hypothetical protein
MAKATAPTASRIPVAATDNNTVVIVGTGSRGPGSECATTASNTAKATPAKKAVFAADAMEFMGLVSLGVYRKSMPHA